MRLVGAQVSQKRTSIVRVVRSITAELARMGKIIVISSLRGDRPQHARSR